MNEIARTVKSSLDPSAPIDFDQLRDAILANGPLRMSQPKNQYVIEITTFRCNCGDADCTNESALVVRRNGLFSIRWMLTREELLEYETLDNLRLCVLSGELDDTCAERQIIEHEIQAGLGCDYTQTDPTPVCFCEDCTEVVGEEALSRSMLLTQLAFQLQRRHSLLFVAQDEHPGEAEALVKLAFDLGYQTGRIFSEFQVKNDIEEHALAGLDFEKLKQKRARSAGVKSSNKRSERISSLILNMERLAQEAGSTALRMGPLNLAKMACEDATTSDPSLWSQGSGQIEEYLGLIRRGEVGAEIQSRYFALFPPNVNACRRTV